MTRTGNRGQAKQRRAGTGGGDKEGIKNVGVEEVSWTYRMRDDAPMGGVWSEMRRREVIKEEKSGYFWEKGQVENGCWKRVMEESTVRDLSGGLSCDWSIIDYLAVSPGVNISQCFWVCDIAPCRAYELVCVLGSSPIRYGTKVYESNMCLSAAKILYTVCVTSTYLYLYPKTIVPML